MPRPKKSPDLQEGPDAFENFRRLADRILKAGRPTVVVEEVETTDEVAVETQHVGPKKRKRRKY